jgi:VCBS repeat-containing protein
MKRSNLSKPILILVTIAFAVALASAKDNPPRLTIDNPTEGQTVQATPGLGPVAIIKFHTDNFKIESVDKDHGSMTQMATNDNPNHGHIQVTVDGSPWYFVHSDNDPILISGLSPGQHSVKLQLAGPNDAPIGTAQTVNFSIAPNTGR